MEFTIIIHAAEEGGYWAEVPVLPGCFTQGDSLDDTFDSAREAIESHLLGLALEGEAPPHERPLIIGRVTVAAPP